MLTTSIDAAMQLGKKLGLPIKTSLKQHPLHSLLLVWPMDDVQAKPSSSNAQWMN
jgi:hypothetical protein